MISSPEPLLYPLKPGEYVPNDWYAKPIPENIEVGDETVIDSSVTFKNFRSTLLPALKVGNYVTLCRASLATEGNAVIEIGDYCYISNAVLVCAERIKLGSHVFLAAGVTIADSDFHPIQPAARMADTVAISPLGNHRQRPPIKSSPVEIESGVWIGFGATILKGVHIGADAVVAPGSVVISDVPAGCTVAGNPAKIVSVA
ncbi:hypothetical protein GCM10023189_16660 [Nibrella saemangeumensis]|uniref:Acyltransferase n=1 Tax=Nibrella saemangeumensis TaxID=1084526 RepID=A0ABP8MM28_9BACT